MDQEKRSEAFEKAPLLVRFSLASQLSSLTSLVVSNTADFFRKQAVIESVLKFLVEVWRYMAGERRENVPTLSNTIESGNAFSNVSQKQILLPPPHFSSKKVPALSFFQKKSPIGSFLYEIFFLHNSFCKKCLHPIIFFERIS